MVEGYASRPGENLDVHHALGVAPASFDLLRIPLLAGRDFRAEDNENVLQRHESSTNPSRDAFCDGRDPVGRQVQIYVKNRSRLWEW